MPRRAITMLLIVSLALIPAGCIGARTEGASTLSYTLPTTLVVVTGEPVPGTEIVYQAYSEQGARFTIEGQPALKRTGDSLQWSGEQVPGARVELKLRVLHANDSSVRLVGTATVVVSDVAPVASPPNKEAEIRYSGVVGYGVPRGGVIPGTTLTYLGPADKGAELGGLGEYPYRLEGDSILWEGHLTPNVALRLDVRVAHYNDQALRVAGLATLWLE